MTTRKVLTTEGSRGLAPQEDVLEVEIERDQDQMIEKGNQKGTFERMACR